MSMRKYLRGLAKAKMERNGVTKINRRMSYSWRKEIGAYPGFDGKKRQKKGSKQFVLRYPIPKGFTFKWKKERRERRRRAIYGRI